MGRRHKEEPQNLTPERMVNSLVYNHCALWQVPSGVWTELPGLCGGRRGGLLSGSCRSLTIGETVMKALGFVVERHVCSLSLCGLLTLHWYRMEYSIVSLREWGPI